mgnify:FL=1
MYESPNFGHKRVCQCICNEIEEGTIQKIVHTLSKQIRYIS